MIQVKSKGLRRIEVWCDGVTYILEYEIKTGYAWTIYYLNEKGELRFIDLVPDISSAFNRLKKFIKNY